MVEKYKAQPNELRGDTHFVLPGDIELVLAADYAALETRLANLDHKFMILQGSHDMLVKERDELKRRLDKIKRETDFVEYVYSEGLARKIRAILEGRDNE